MLIHLITSLEHYCLFSRPPYLFDGVCNLCNGAVQFVIARDPLGQFAFASLQSDTGQRALLGLGLPTGQFDSFVYIKGPKAYLRSTAALHVLKDIGGFWAIAYAFIAVPRPVRDAVYDLVARYRYRWFGKRDVCMIPTPELSKRFL